jgi:hypothetical protein
MPPLTTKLTRFKRIPNIIRIKAKNHFLIAKSSDPIKNEIYNGFIKFNIVMELGGHKYPTSITLKKNIVSLWLVMMDKIHCDHNRVIMDFIEKICLKRWRGNTAKGMSDFVVKCMIHSMLEKEDFDHFKMIYLSLNGRVKNPSKILNTKHGDGHIKIQKEGGDSEES